MSNMLPNVMIKFQYLYLGTLLLVVKEASVFMNVNYLL